MRFFMVTVKFPRNRKHDPLNKVAGPCPATGKDCTDSTGQHHTVMVNAKDISEAEYIARNNWAHITRIEEV